MINRKSSLPFLSIVPIVDFLLSLVFCVAVPLLNFSFELIAAPCDHVYVVIRELSPLFLGFSFDLLPVAFDLVSIHFDLRLHKLRMRV